jgi:hypothetical protein
MSAFRLRHWFVAPGAVPPKRRSVSRHSEGFSAKEIGCSIYYIPIAQKLSKKLD